MSQSPEILMLDEPCSNLDFNWKQQITDMIDELFHQLHMTVLMVSHETNLLPPSCRRIVLLHQGRLLADDTVENVFDSELLETAYNCPVRTADIAGRKYAYIARKKQT